MSGEEALALARRKLAAAEDAVYGARARLEAASIQARNHLDASGRKKAAIAAELGISASDFSKFAPTSPDSDWSPGSDRLCAAFDRGTGGVYRLAVLRAEFDAATEARTKAGREYRLAQSNLDGTPAPRNPQPEYPVFALPARPAHFVPRLAKRAEVVRAVAGLAAGQGGAVGVSSAADLHGTGGYGKTTLALDVAHQPEVRELFPDGVAFIEIGPNPSVVTLLSDWTSLLMPETAPARYGSIDAAATAFLRALGDRRMLLVLDNVWKPEDVAPFLQGGPRCVRLITSRRTDLLPSSSVGVDVDRMEPEEAVELLLRDVPDATAADVFPLYERSSRWPVVLSLLNGVLRGRTTGQRALPVKEVVAALATRLQQSGVFATDDLAPQSDRTAAAVIEISIEDLATAHRDRSLLDRFVSLAAFPASGAIDFTVLGRLWRCDEIAVRATCDELAKRSLLEAAGQAGTHLHDVIHDHLLRTRLKDIRAVNAELVALFRARCPDGEWHRIPAADEHFLEHLAYHLLNSDHEDELAELLRDLRFVSRRILQGGPAQLEDDLAVCATGFARDPYQQRFSRVLRFAGHLVTKVDDIRGIAATLHSRVLEEDSLADWLRHAAEALGGGWRAAHPMPDRPDSRLLSISVGHTEPVTGLTWRPDGEQFASGSSDGTVRFWDRGGSPQRLVPVPGEVERIAWSPARLHVAVLTGSGTLTLIEPIYGHSTTSQLPDGETWGLAWAPDATAVALGGRDRVVLWDPHNSRLVHTLDLPRESHVRDVAWHPVGGLAALAGDEVFCWKDISLPPRRVSVDMNVPKMLTWAPDGDVLAVAGADRHVALIVPFDAPGVVARSDDIGSWVTAAQWSHDGSAFAGGTDQGEVAVWGPPGTGAVDLLPASPERERWDQRLERREGIDLRRTRVSSLAWHPARPLLAVGSHTKDVRVFDLTLRPDNPDTVQVNCVRWHPKRPLVVAGTVEGELVLASAEGSGDRWTVPAHCSEVRAVAVAPDGERLVSLAEDGFALWHLAIDNRLRRLPASVRIRFGGAAAWSADGNVLALGGQGEVVLADTAEWTVRERIDVGDLVNGVDLHPDAPLVAIATTSSTVLVHNFATGATVELEGHTSTVGSVRWAPSGRTLVSTGYDGRALRWTFTPDLGAAECAQLRERDSPVWDAAVDPSTSDVLTVTTSGMIDVTGLNDSRHVQSIAVDGALGCIDVSARGRHVVAGGASGLYFLTTGDVTPRT